MKTNVDDLRNHLFETLEMLKDGDERMTIEKARAISDVAQTIINTARVELEFQKASKNKTGSRFIPLESDEKAIEQARPSENVADFKQVGPVRVRYRESGN
jgi:hypothetical protein